MIMNKLFKAKGNKVQVFMLMQEYTFPSEEVAKDFTDRQNEREEEHLSKPQGFGFVGKKV
jgi:hypothetical protein